MISHVRRHFVHTVTSEIIATSRSISWELGFIPRSVGIERHIAMASVNTQSGLPSEICQTYQWLFVYTAGGQCAAILVHHVVPFLNQFPCKSPIDYDYLGNAANYITSRKSFKIKIKLLHIYKPWELTFIGHFLQKVTWMQIDSRVNDSFWLTRPQNPSSP